MKKTQKTVSFEIKEINEEDRSFLAVGSTEDIDRDSDRILASGWELENFKKNPVIPWAHRYGDPPVAQAIDVYTDDGKLLFRPKFASAAEYPFADTIYRLYKGGYLRSFSVGFMPKRYEIVERSNKRLGYDFIETELWEISACTVPANPHALVAAKTAGVITDADLETLSAESLPDIFVRLSAIEKSLRDLGGIVDEIPRFPQNFNPLSIDEMEKKLAELAHGLRQLEAAARPKNSPGPTEFGEKEMAAVAKAVCDRAAETLAAIVENRVAYHLGKVD